MPEQWMPGAIRLDIGDHAPTDGGPAKAIAHITWDRNATATKPADLVPYENLRNYFGKNSAGRAAAPHILWDPFTGRITQFLPANSRSKSLADKPGGTRTNRAGSVVIQVEALFFPHCRVNGKVYARLVDTPCKGWDELLAWIRSWGVPDTWPMGRPTDFASRRSEATWRTEAGWYAHAHVPENDHQDPGSWPSFVAAEGPSGSYEVVRGDTLSAIGRKFGVGWQDLATANGIKAPYTIAPGQKLTIPGATATPRPPAAPRFPGRQYFKSGANNKYVTQLGQQLVKRGYGQHYTVGPGPRWGDADRRNVEAFQRAQGWTGTDADGYPGPETWKRLFA
ncbi:peptidoglycan-binding protein [Streptomyces sp. NPDC088258]|uniref:LysM peptidoglycan-binding domain-containing protein n=1 Tax=Streptomyces sp. NPDC088258 TaxID=3365849 RepID=UPI0037FDCB5B